MRVRRTRWAALAATTLVASSFAAIAPTMATAQSSSPKAAAPVAAASSAAPAPLGQKAVSVARAHLRAGSADLGLSGADVDELTVSSVVPSPGNGLTNVYFQQRVKSIDVVNAMVNVAVRADGSILRVASNAVASASKKVNTTSPTIGDVQAAQRAAEVLGLTPTGSFDSSDSAAGTSRSRTLDAAGISSEAIPVQLVFQEAKDGSLRLAWQLVVNQLDGEHWWQIRIDATSGAEIGKNDWVAEDSHNVFAFPVEAPSFGSRSVVTNPAVAAASPFGWNDTNGAAGAESTVTTGNNVNAYTDTDNDNAPDAGSQPNGGAGLSFNFPLDLSQPPSTYRPAAVSNLYYANNRIHDVMYRFGFDEAAGNFQVNNYGKGGSASDPVQAEAQDGGGTNNANFATPPDGSDPRMQMYLWNLTSPQVDGDLDNGIIIHEYGHGISNRLTGGPATTSCLGNQEQAGEGWSDWYALAMTQQTATENPGGRGIGTYALGQPTTGAGIRTKKYSTDLAVNDFTYDDIKTLAVPHGVGSVWATMTWDLYWALVDEYGHTANLVTGNGGNARAMQLVTDGLKLQPCSPGFVDARDAILDADVADYGGANQCLIWDVFARRGLGFSASQGSANDRSDGVEAFDLPPSCNGVALTASGSPDPVPGGQQITYTLQATNTSGGPVAPVKIESTIGDHATYVAGSANCSGTYDAPSKTVTFQFGMAAGESLTCTLKALTDSSPVSSIKLEDDVEPDLSGFMTSHASGATDWALSTALSHSPTHSAFADEPATVSDKYLRTAAPVAIATGDELTFWSSYGLESGYDGGVVEVSTDGGSTWSDVGSAAFSQNGYDGVISGCCSNPIAGREAFTGASGGWIKSVASLSAYAGQNALVRWRATSDTSVSGSGWSVDDVSIGNVVSTTNTLVLTAPTFPTQTQGVTTVIVAGTGTAPAAPTVTKTTPLAAGAMRVTFTPNGIGGPATTSYTARCISSNGGATKTVSGSGSPITLGALTIGKTYRCRVLATNAVGSSPYSAPGLAVVANNATAPPAPTVTGTVPLAAGAVRVAFAPTGDGGSPVTGYTAQCVSTNGGVTKSATGTTSPVTVAGLTLAKSYHCRTRATNAVGTGAYGAYGATVVANNATAPAPVGVASTTPLSGSRIRVTFAAPADGGSPISGYTAQCVSTNGGVTKTATAAASPILVLALSSGKSYHCRAQATNAVGTSAFGAYGATVVAT